MNFVEAGVINHEHNAKLYHRQLDTIAVLGSSGCEGHKHVVTKWRKFDGRKMWRRGSNRYRQERGVRVVDSKGSRAY